MTTIRAAGPDDAEQLAKLSQFVQALHLQQRPDHFRATHVPELTAWYRNLLERPTTRAWVAHMDGAPVGERWRERSQQASETPFTQARVWLEISLTQPPNMRLQPSAPGGIMSRRG
jgi:hypothetical protein